MLVLTTAANWLAAPLMVIKSYARVTALDSVLEQARYYHHQLMRMWKHSQHELQTEPCK